MGHAQSAVWVKLPTTGLLWLSSAALYIAALANPAVVIDHQSANTWPGWALLLLGWLPLTSAAIGWYANPAFLLSWLLRSRGCDREDLLTATFALSLSLWVLVDRKVVVSEAPTYGAITHLGLGYWLWVGAMLANLATAALAFQPQPPVE